MHDFIRRSARVAIVVAAIGVLTVGGALAAQQSTITKFSGTTTTGGSWTRTITDVTEPHGPNGGTVLATYNVVVTYGAGTTDVQMAQLYKNACTATLPSPATGANGYGAVFNNGNNRHVRLSKQNGTYDYSDAGLPTKFGGPPNQIAAMTVVTDPPMSVEDAPAVSPVGLAALAGGLAVIAWRVPRRRRSGGSTSTKRAASCHACRPMLTLGVPRSWD